MVENGSKKSPKVAKKFVCNLCDYSTSKHFDYEKHLATQKHKNATNGSKMVENGSNLSQFVANVAKSHTCFCGKTYKYNSGFYRHKKTCMNSDDIDGVNIKDKDALVMHLLKQNGELQSKLLEMATVSTNTNNNHNNNSFNTNNTSFNLNFFLNETCKDAMNMTDFVSSIKVSLEDLEHTGRKGYIEGISNIIVKNLNKLEQHMRPLHCSDAKREVLYIKDNNEWTKESLEKPILTKAVKTIANENIKKIQQWIDKYPDCTQVESKKNNLYLKIVGNSMNGLTKEEGDKNIHRIISNIAKETVIQK